MKILLGFLCNRFGLWISVFALLTFSSHCTSDKSGTPNLSNLNNPNNNGAVSGSGGTNTDTYSNGSTGGTGAVSSNLAGSIAFEALSEICKAEEFVPNKPVYMMLLQDLSYSLTVDVDGKSKWEHAKEALTSILTDPAYKNIGIRFGFDYFPDTAVNINATTSLPVYGCGVDDPVVVDTDLNTGSQIIDWINSHEPEGATPLYCAINKFNDPNYAPNFINANGDKYLLVISDGADACGIDCATNEDPQQYASPDQLAQVTSQLRGPSGQDGNQQGIRTIVIGFGDSVAPSELNAISQAGGVFDEYLDARTSEDLQLAFETILCHL